MAKIIVGVDGSVGARRALSWAAAEAHLAAGARGVLDDALDEVKAVHADIEIAGELTEARAASALIAAAGDADLLVVGSRGRGGFSGLLLGSVSTQCVHHAPCPVVVIPPEGSVHGLR